ncbi:MAG: hypothetical protein MR625_01725 [Clostridium sp.]|mgnify:FL=1|nr:hypothetical protein [Clostridium sp.]
MNINNTIEKNYRECLAFNRAAGYTIDETEFDITVAQTALQELYHLYEAGIASGKFQRDTDYVVRAEDIVRVIRDREAEQDKMNGNYNAWRIWLRYFVSMGYDSWNELWRAVR